MHESKEYIKARMFKNAARLWGYPASESEQNFDPVFSLLLTACADELEKVNNDIYAAKTRMLERMMQLLTPGVLKNALPAHAIAYALPLENASDIREDAQFFTHLNAGKEAATRDVFFSPSDTFRLQKASVRYMAQGSRLIHINNNLEKEIMATSLGNRSLPASTLWLGIDEPGISLHNCLFYFDFCNELYSEWFYCQLPKVKWMFQDGTLEHLPGYGNRNICGEIFDLENSNHNCVISKIKRQVNSFYQHCFLTLLDPADLLVSNDLVGLPEVFHHTFSEKEVDLLQQQSMRWICLQFPETISNQLLQDLSCQLNCFPVINRHIHESTYRLNELLNLIPLFSDDFFLDLEEVCTDEIKLFPSVQKEDKESIAITVRECGSGRFDERDAAALTQYLLQLLQEESAAFTECNRELIASELQQLQQVMNKLEQCSFSRLVRPVSTPYLIIRNYEKRPGKHLFIRYWSTNGQEANHLKASTPLQLYKGSLLHNNMAILVSPTRGGRDQLNNSESMLAFKTAFLSRDRLLTTEDIKAFCHFQLGDKVKRVTIKKSVQIQKDEHQGLARTLDVIIEIDEKSYNEMSANGDLLFWQANLKLLLEEKSSAWMPYRVVISQLGIEL